jgi:uncharacterized protein YyaL (SSP411 family)
VTLHWHDWSDAAFEQARERGVPVLLVVHAHWCRFSRELERRVLRDASVVERIERGFVAISVEKSRRPDIAVRYSRGGWPTLAFLDEQGELFASEGFLEPEELAARLDLIERYWRAECGSLRARLAQRAGLGESGAVARAELKPELLAEIGAHLLETSDPYHGGWGSQHKFPHPESLDFALLRWSQTGDEALRKLVLRTLRNMQSGEIHDRVEGGFYRYSTAPDWSGPHHEKVLDGNAERLRSYLEGYQALGDASFKTTAEGVLDWMQTTLLDRETGAFRGSQDADPVYAHLRTREARAQHGAPECDPTIFAHANACAASALFLAGDVLERPECTEQAVRTLEFVLDALCEPRDGVLHYWDGVAHLPGLLTDQAYVLRALLDAAEHTGRARYVAAAEALARKTCEQLWSHEGGFWDTRHDPGARGSLRRRERSLADNARMAEALLRLSCITHEPRWRELARETLESFAGEFKRQGHAMSLYARAASLLMHPPVHVAIVGAPERDDTRALQRAALAPYLAHRIVQLVDPADRLTLERLELPWEGGGAHAYVSRGRASYADTADAQRLPSLMARVESAV